MSSRFKPCQVYISCYPTEMREAHAISTIFEGHYIPTTYRGEAQPVPADRRRRAHGELGDIERCLAVIVLLSPTAVDSPTVWREAVVAVALGRCVVPIAMPGIDPDYLPQRWRGLLGPVHVPRYTTPLQVAVDTVAAGGPPGDRKLGTLPATEAPVGAPEPPDLRLDADDVHHIAFDKPPMLRRGHNEDQVDELLDAIEAKFRNLDDPAVADLTPQSLLEVELRKPRMGQRGYHPGQVEEFLDFCAAELARRLGERARGASAAR